MATRAKIEKKKKHFKRYLAAPDLLAQIQNIFRQMFHI